MSSIGVDNRKENKTQRKITKLYLAKGKHVYKRK